MIYNDGTFPKGLLQRLNELVHECAQNGACHRVSATEVFVIIMAQ